jgi:hypothetical protein
MWKKLYFFGFKNFYYFYYMEVCFFERGYHKNIDAMKLINNFFCCWKTCLEKIAHVECVFWKKKLFFIKWGIMKNSTLNAQQQMCSTMFRSKCLLHSCVNDVFYIRFFF